MHKIKLTMIWLGFSMCLIEIGFAVALYFTPVSTAAENGDIEALRKRVQELEIDKLKLRLNLADEKLVNLRFESLTLVLDRKNICNELQATDKATFEARCTDKGSK